MLHPKYGGPPAVVFSHAVALSSNNNEVCVFGCAEQGESSQIKAKFDNVWTTTPSWPLRWMRASGLLRRSLNGGPTLYMPMISGSMDFMRLGKAPSQPALYWRLLRMGLLQLPGDTIRCLNYYIVDYS